MEALAVVAVKHSGDLDWTCGTSLRRPCQLRSAPRWVLCRLRLACLPFACRTFYILALRGSGIFRAIILPLLTATSLIRSQVLPQTADRQSPCSLSLSQQ